VCFEDALPATHAGREKIPSSNQRFAPLAHFVHERHRQHMTEEYDFEEHIWSLKTLADFVNVSTKAVAVPSAGRLLLTLNSVDTDIFPRVFAVNESAT
jgi:hypothetical protein